MDEVVVSGTRLFYRLGDAMPLRDGAGRYRRDERGRIALEAFMALPVGAMYQRFAAYLGSIKQSGGEPDEAGYRDAFTEVVGFVELFGPLALEWTRLHLVENPEADRLAEENWRRTIEVLEVDSSHPPQRRTFGSEIWRLRLPRPGISEHGQVERVTTFPDLPWHERVRLGDERVPHDDLGVANVGPLASAHWTLGRVLALVDALPKGKPLEVRAALEDFPRYPAFWVGERARQSSMELDWRASMRGMAPADGWFLPFKAHPGQVDWLEFGRQILAEHFHYELSSTSIGVGLRNGKVALGWRHGSLMEVIYLQLLDHVIKHPEFGIGTCDFCGAGILRVRRGQRWHTGCAPAGRQRESRADRKRRAASASGNAVEN